MRVYLTGANGRLGKTILERMNVVALVRRKTGIEGEITCDYSKKALEDILSDADVIIHLAGSRDFLDPEKARAGNVKLTETILDAIPGNSKMVYSSSISVYGKKMSEIPADENTPANPDSPYAKSKLEAEEVIKDSGISHSILRIGPVYGRGFQEYFKVLNMIEKEKMPIIGSGENRIPFVHSEDLSDVIKTSTLKGEGTYVVTGESLSQERIFEIASEKLGVKMPSSHVPVFLAKAYSCLELLRSEHLGGSPKFIPEDIAVLSSDRVFDCSKAKEGLGFSPRSLKKGVEEMVDDYRQDYKI